MQQALNIDEPEMNPATTSEDRAVRAADVISEADLDAVSGGGGKAGGVVGSIR